jgi:hypothetical protein
MTGIDGIKMHTQTLYVKMGKYFRMFTKKAPVFAGALNM